MKNNYVSIEPNIVSLTEYSKFEQTFDFSYSVPPEIASTLPTTYNYVFHNIINDPTLPEFAQKNLYFSKISNTSFKIGGEFSDVFLKEIKYRDAKGEKKMSQYYNSMPVDYSAVYSYRPPSLNTIAFTFLLKLKPAGNTDLVPDESILHTYEIKFLIKNNSTINLQKFRELLDNGRYNKKSIENGYSD